MERKVRGWWEGFREGGRVRKRISFGVMALVMAGIACNVPGGGGGATATAPGQAAEASPTAPGATQLPSTSAPTAAPATAGPSEPVRIEFATGATSATMEGAVAAGKQDYLLYALAEQTMTVTVTATGGPVGLTVLTPSAVPLIRSQLGETTWSGTLPETGDYTISVVLLGADSAHYTLEVVIPPPGEQVNCTVTTGQTLTAYSESSLTANVFGTATAGTETFALARTTDGWIGFDPGVAQAGNEGRARLRWYLTDPANLSFSPAGCENGLEVVLSLASLENGTYQFGESTVTLTDGEYTNPNFDPASTEFAVHDTFMGQARAFGDLDGDGDEDAVIVLATNTGGSGTFVEIMPVLNNHGNPQPLTGFLIGDRSPVRALRIEDGVVIADVTVPDADDPACCPTSEQTWRLRLEGGELVEQP